MSHRETSIAAAAGFNIKKSISYQNLAGPDFKINLSKGSSSQ